MKKNEEGVFFVLIMFCIFMLKSCGTSEGNYEEALPPFPWPPPKASATLVIDNELMTDENKEETYLGDINRKLVDALNKNGYFERYYFSVPEGFAIVTRIERYNEDGTIVNQENRWNAEFINNPKEFSFKNILKLLFTANPGYYRFIAFIVTSTTITQDTKTMEYEDWQEWMQTGGLWLPNSIAKKIYTEDYRCTALIYEYERYKNEEVKTYKTPGRLNGWQHLSNNNFLFSLRGEQ